MFSFLKKLFKKKKVEEPVNMRPLEVTQEEEVTFHRDEEIPKIWVSKVSAFDEKTITLELSEIKETTVLPFAISGEMDFSVPKGNETVRFRAKVLDIQNTSLPYSIIIEFPTSRKVEWQSRVRKHVRIPSNIPAKLALDNINQTWHMVHISDISLSGLSIYSSQPFKKGDRVLVKLMSMQYPLELTGEVVRAIILVEHSDPDKDGTEYNLGIKLDGQGEVKEQMLSDFIFQLQRKNTEFEKRYFSY